MSSVNTISSFRAVSASTVGWLAQTTLLALLATGCGTNNAEPTNAYEIEVVTRIAAKQLGTSQDAVDLSVPLNRHQPPGDDLDLAEIVIAIEQELGITFSAQDLATPGDVESDLNLQRLVDAIVRARR